MTRLILTCSALILAPAQTSDASAEVSSRSETGFILSLKRRATASVEEVFSATGRPAASWSDAHTSSGDAGNLHLDLQGRRLLVRDPAGGGVQHGRTLLVWPDQRMARFDAPLGPLQSIGADAVLTMSWLDVEDGQARLLEWTFVVQGAGAGAMADAVDAALAEQIDHLADHLEPE